jgi:hypothetical protein
MKHMEHISEHELVAYVFGDAAETEAIDTHLAQCAHCTQEVAKLRAILSAVNDETLPVPEREHYEEQVWASVKPRLQAATEPFSWTHWFRPQRLAIAGGLLALVIVAFVAGKFSNRDTQPPPVLVVTDNSQRLDRLTRAAVSEHLERSQMMLVELSNAEAGKEGVDISDEQERARDLLESNRLYRQSAKRTRDPAVNAVLDELERVLIEIANSPSELSKQRLAELQQQIQDQEILFKVRVIGSKVRSTKDSEPSAKNASQRRL